jgi:hypothetical protein
LPVVLIYLWGLCGSVTYFREVKKSDSLIPTDVFIDVTANKKALLLPAELVFYFVPTQRGRVGKLYYLAKVFI